MAELQRWSQPKNSGRDSEDARVVEGEYCPSTDEVISDVKSIFDNLLADLHIPKEYVCGVDPNRDTIDAEIVREVD